MSVTRPGAPSGTQPGREGTGISAYEVVLASTEFQSVRRRFGSFAVPALGLVLGWYFLYVIVAAFAPGFMRIRVLGDVNAGMCFGLLQFASTFAITVAYSRWTRRRLDPESDQLRDLLEKGRGR